MKCDEEKKIKLHSILETKEVSSCWHLDTYWVRGGPQWLFECTFRIRNESNTLIYCELIFLWYAFNEGKVVLFNLLLTKSFHQKLSCWNILRLPDHWNHEINVREKKWECQSECVGLSSNKYLCKDDSSCCSTSQTMHRCNIFVLCFLSQNINHRILYIYNSIFLNFTQISAVAFWTIRPSKKSPPGITEIPAGLSTTSTYFNVNLSFNELKSDWWKHNSHHSKFLYIFIFIECRKTCWNRWFYPRRSMIFVLISNRNDCVLICNHLDPNWIFLLILIFKEKEVISNRSNKNTSFLINSSMTNTNNITTTYFFNPLLTSWMWIMI